MGIFKSADEHSIDPQGDLEDSLPDAVIDMARRRARRRLLGSIVLVLVALILVPMAFDTDNAPITDNVAIDVPAKDSPVDFSPSGEALRVPPSTDVSSNDETASKDEPAASSGLSVPSLPISKTSAANSNNEPARAVATPRPAIPPLRTGYALQVGAFASNQSAQTLQQRIATAGLNSYTETISSPQGNRYRVRVGPFPTRDAAEQARNKLKLLGLDNTMIESL